MVALEIAMDHLDEDPRYYQKLRKIHRENPDQSSMRKRWSLPEGQRRGQARKPP